MKVIEFDFSFPLGPLNPHDCFQRSESHGHVARIRGDALFALPEDGVNAIETFKRATAAAGLSFIALRKSRIVKIKTASPLHQITTYRRHVAQLRTGTCHQSFTQDRV